jgi:hypothetical protein
LVGGALSDRSGGAPLAAPPDATLHRVHLRPPGAGETAVTRHRTPSTTHAVDPEVLAPVVEGFLG